MWNESEVERIARTCSGLTAQQMIALVVETTDRFTGEAPQADDMTVVAIRV
jgi:serine phosphatase RsbU (regulator of sigma subunit)